MYLQFVFIYVSQPLSLSRGIISHSLTVSIDYPEKRLQENTTYKLKGIILEKKIIFNTLQGTEKQ